MSISPQTIGEMLTMLFSQKISDGLIISFCGCRNDS